MRIQYCHHPPRREEMTSPPLPGRLNRKTRSDAAQFTRNRITCNYRAGRGGSLSDRWLFRSAIAATKLRIFERDYGHFARASSRWTKGGFMTELNSLAFASRGSNCRVGEKVILYCKNFLVDLADDVVVN